MFTYFLTPCSGVLLEKLNGSQSRIYPHFMETEGWLSRLKVPATCPYPELYFNALSIYIYIYIYIKFFLLKHKGNFSLNQFHIAFNKTQKYTQLKKTRIIKFNCGQITKHSSLIFTHVMQIQTNKILPSKFLVRSMWMANRTCNTDNTVYLWIAVCYGIWTM
jgi:hypothetical protein